MAIFHIHGLACILRVLFLICPNANPGATYDLIGSRLRAGGGAMLWPAEFGAADNAHAISIGPRRVSYSQREH